MKKIVMYLGVGVGLLMAGCVTVTLTPEETAFQQKFSTQATEFNLPKAQADEAWGRALSFVNKYASMKMKETSDTMIATYLPDDGLHYGYSIMRTTIGDKVKFIVNCESFSGGDVIATHNAQIAALYITTGTEPLPGTLDTCWHVSCK